MTDRVLLTASLTLLLIALSSFIYAARAANHDWPHTGPRCDEDCQERVQRREAHEKWRAVVNDYGPGLLRARMRCESGSHGGYELATTGNGYWFAHQLNLAAWLGAGGRIRDGRPVGVWSTQPEALEQDYRAVRWDWVHGGDPWPNCP